ncbi:DEKNAAC103929 [Brettanomyces naardenensis]|uniref:DEKNAAC103929 n=1 Tax=Brettanomyces naardenensis TaxID=13370 RepID=A0A448YPI1_BRENA|nr:DEKNAAC103929 [Brettanomyces naardenensis]
MSSGKALQGGVAAFTPFDHAGIHVTTGNDLPGFRIIKDLGLIYGTTVRSRNIGADIGAVAQSLVGGELTPLTKNVVNSRNEAVDRMISAAMSLGATGVIAFRFDCGSLGRGFTEVCCYGTAVEIEKDNWANE